MLIKITQPCTCTRRDGDVWLILLCFHQSGGVHHLVRHPNILRWQYSLSDAALHLRLVMGEFQQHTFCHCKCDIKAASNFLHGLVDGVSLRKLSLQRCEIARFANRA